MGLGSLIAPLALRLASRFFLGSGASVGSGSGSVLGILVQEILEGGIGFALVAGLGGRVGLWLAMWGLGCLATAGLQVMLVQVERAWLFRAGLVAVLMLLLPLLGSLGAFGWGVLAVPRGPLGFLVKLVW
jgi:hypothetical protein